MPTILNSFVMHTFFLIKLCKMVGILQYECNVGLKEKTFLIKAMLNKMSEINCENIHLSKQFFSNLVKLLKNL